MFTFRHLARAVACLAAAQFSVTAQAQLFRAYLASAGSDANPCTLQAPCRLLPAALGAVASGGEIWMLDSANYNAATVNINKSVSILAVPGVVGSVLAIGGPAISITVSGLKVALRNLVVAPLSGAGGTDGVHMTGASTLTVENSLIANLPSNGVLVEGTGVLKVSDTTLRNNGVFGIVTVNGVSAMITRSQMLGNADGGFSAQVNSAAATSVSSVSDSVISGGSDGVYARAAVNNSLVRISVTRTTIDKTTYGLLSYTSCNPCGASIAISSSMIANNEYGWYQDGAGSVIQSLGNNHFTGNNQVFGSLTPTPLQ
jgi:hypothetical protein